MAKVIPFPHASEVAAYALALSARLERLRRGKPVDPPRHPEQLGNLLQHLVTQRPAVLLVIESVVTEMVRQVGP